MEKTSLLRHSLNISVITLLSRVFGLVRVRLEALVLGGGSVASGWFLAFALPNLFRRLLGEGALGQALIPLIAEAERAGGKVRVNRELAVIFAWLGVVLGVIVIVIAGGAMLGEYLTASVREGFFAEERIRIFLKLVPLLIPYAFFMCFVGAMSAVLNYSRVFVLPALGALLLNIFLIGGLSGILCGVFGGETVLDKLHVLGLLVLTSGACQLTMMLVLLKHYDRFPSWKEIHLVERSAVLSKLFKMLVPGLASGALLQISFIIDRFLAIWIGAQALPSLVYVDRLVDVPIGIFAISISSVLMASMSRSAAEGNMEQIVSELIYSLRQVFFISVPMTVALLFFHESMIRLLCYGGRFTASDLEATRLVAYFYGGGIPIFCATKVVVPVFLARKKMLTTFYVSVAALSLNLVLNLLLMIPLKQGGIALATLFSSLFALGNLFVLLVREGFSIPFRKIGNSFVRSSGAAAVAAAVVNATGWMTCHLEWSWFRQFALFSAGGILFCTLYIALTALLRFPEFDECRNVFLRKKA